MITLTKSGGTVSFVFDDNSTYLQNGTIDVPVNSLSLIIDESNMVTFRKSASNDIFVSANIAEFGMSKSELEAWYKANLVGSTGGGGGITSGEVQTMIDESISGLAESSAVTEEISEAVSGKADVSAATISTEATGTFSSGFTNSGWTNLYFSTAFTYDDGVISFSGKANTGVAIEQCTIKYTTIDGVEKNGSQGTTDDYVIVWGGSQARVVVTMKGTNRLTDLSVLYETAIDNSFNYTYDYIRNELVAVSTVIENTINPKLNEIEASLSGKADSSDVQTLSGTVTAHTADTSIHFTTGDVQSQIDSSISGITADMAEDERVTAAAFNAINETLSAKADSSAVTVEISEAVSGKQDTLSAGTGIQISGNVISATGGGGGGITSGEVQSMIDESVSGKVDTSSVVSSVTSASTDSEIPTAKAVWDAIPTGSTGGSCTVSTNVIYDTYETQFINAEDKYTNKYVIFDNQDKVNNYSVGIYFLISDGQNYPVNGTIVFDYTGQTYTLEDQSWADYLDITYDTTINDFVISIASEYQSSCFFYQIYNLPYNFKLKVPAYTITSGDPCTVIENGVNGALSMVNERALGAYNYGSLNGGDNYIDLSLRKGDFTSQTSRIKLEELVGTDNTLRPNIYVGTQVSGWTELDINGSTCQINDLKINKFRVTYDYETFYDANMHISFEVIVQNYTSYYNENVSFDQSTELPSLTSDISGASITWDALTKELIVEYPLTIDIDGSTYNVFVKTIYSNSCQLGQTISKVEKYGEIEEPLKQYVQETRGQLGGLSLQKISQSDYDDLVSSGLTDSNTLYIIND